MPNVYLEKLAAMYQVEIPSAPWTEAKHLSLTPEEDLGVEHVKSAQVNLVRKAKKALEVMSGKTRERAKTLSEKSLQKYKDSSSKHFAGSKDKDYVSSASTNFSRTSRLRDLAKKAKPFSQRAKETSQTLDRGLYNNRGSLGLAIGASAGGALEKRKQEKKKSSK